MNPSVKTKFRLVTVNIRVMIFCSKFAKNRKKCIGWFEDVWVVPLFGENFSTLSFSILFKSNFYQAAKIIAIYFF